MSRYEQGFEEHEGEPILEMNMRFGENVIPMKLTRENTAIFTHSAEYSHFDHIFVQMEETPESEEYSAIGAFIWRQVLPDWEELKDALAKRDYQHIHSPFPSEHDVEQYESTDLQPARSLFDRPKPEEVKVIEEVEDDAEVEKAMAKIDAELDWFLNDPHYYDIIKPRKGDESQ